MNVTERSQFTETAVIKEPGEYLISIDLGSALGYFWSVLELVWSVLGYFWSILGFGASRNDPNDVEDCTISFH